MLLFNKQSVCNLTENQFGLPSISSPFGPANPLPIQRTRCTFFFITTSNIRVGVGIGIFRPGFRCFFRLLWSLLFSFGTIQLVFFCQRRLVFVFQVSPSFRALPPQGLGPPSKGESKKEHKPLPPSARGSSRKPFAEKRIHPSLLLEAAWSRQTQGRRSQRPEPAHLSTPNSSPGGAKERSFEGPLMR